MKANPQIVTLTVGQIYKAIQPIVISDNKDIFEFYLRRKNRYYFRGVESMLGVKMSFTLHGCEARKFTKGERVMLTLE
jgi:hypothetical protein